jgi:hypothetical protein
MRRAAGFAVAALLVLSAGPADAQSGGIKMPMVMPEGPADFAPTRQAYTANHRFLVKLQALPQPIPYEKYFDLRFAVYDGHDPTKPLTGVTLTVAAGMRHGLKSGFAHAMQSAPKVAEKDGEFTLSGMYFHMMGPWTLDVTVHQGGKDGTSEFRLPCCGP